MGCWFNRHNYVKVHEGEFEVGLYGIPIGRYVQAIEYHCTKCGDRKVVPL